MKDQNKYKCEDCGGVFEKGWNDNDAIKEAEENFGEYSKENMVLICDDCYKKIMGVKQ